MRTSSLITISLPPRLVTEAEKVARKKHMTRSELLRTALRRYLEAMESTAKANVDTEVAGMTMDFIRRYRGALEQLAKK